MNAIQVYTASNTSGSFPVSGYTGAILDLMDTWMRYWDYCPAVQKLPKELVSGSFPPADIYEDADKSIVYECAVAGYKEDDIDLTFEDDTMYITLPAKEVHKDRRYIQRGLKSSKSETGYYLPFDRYYIEKAKASLVDGVLKIVIPMREEVKPVKLKVNQ